jgi:hypothetical protein
MIGPAESQFDSFDINCTFRPYRYRIYTNTRAGAAHDECDHGRLNREKWSVMFGQSGCILPTLGKLLSGFASA